jgi:hypothetical protein
MTIGLCGLRTRATFPIATDMDTRILSFEFVQGRQTTSSTTLVPEALVIAAGLCGFTPEQHFGSTEYDNDTRIHKIALAQRGSQSPHRQ